MITAITTPTTFMNGYSAIPLRVTDTSATSIANYKYLFNILWDGLTVTTTSTYTYGSDIYQTINYATAHSYKNGDLIFINDTSGDYTGYYTVFQVPSSTSIRINLVVQKPITGTLTTYKAIRYKMNPSPDGDAKIDFGNTIKDFITQDLSDVNEIYAGDNTRFRFTINTGYQSNAFLEFYDNYFSSGNVGFISSTDTLATTTLEVGDIINIQQDLLEFDYSISDSYVDTDGLTKLRLYTTTFNVGLLSTNQSILINGQTSYPDGNGWTTVNNASGSYIYTNMVTSMPTGSFFEGGKVYVNLIPSYNATTKIIDMFDVSGELVIVTDIDWWGSSPAIGGRITSDSLKRKDVWNGPTYLVNAFNSYVKNLNYSLTHKSDYILFNSTSVGGASTILSRTTKNRIEQSTKSWLLYHNESSNLSDGVRFWWYDANDNALGVTYVINTTSNLEDFYCPIGVDQIIACVNKSGDDPSTFLSSISYYKVQAVKDVTGTAAPIGKELIFELNDDCTRYDIYHLMWKDAQGSWISYPFKYISIPSTEVSRSNYYRNSWNWDNNSFGYDSFSKGDASYFTKGRDKISLNSGWVTEEENALIKDLMLSASVYIQDKDGVLQSCTILNSELTYGTKQKDDIFQYKLDVKYSNDENRY